MRSYCTVKLVLLFLGWNPVKGLGGTIYREAVSRAIDTIALNKTKLLCLHESFLEVRQKTRIKVWHRKGAFLGSHAT